MAKANRVCLIKRIPKQRGIYLATVVSGKRIAKKFVAMIEMLPKDCSVTKYLDAVKNYADENEHTVSMSASGSKKLIEENVEAPEIIYL